MESWRPYGDVELTATLFFPYKAEMQIPLCRPSFCLFLWRRDLQAGCDASGLTPCRLCTRFLCHRGLVEVSWPSFKARSRVMAVSKHHHSAVCSRNVSYRPLGAGIPWQIAMVNQSFGFVANFVWKWHLLVYDRKHTRKELPLNWECRARSFAHRSKVSHFLMLL